MTYTVQDGNKRSSQLNKYTKQLVWLYQKRNVRGGELVSRILYGETKHIILSIFTSSNFHNSAEYYGK